MRLVVFFVAFVSVSVHAQMLDNTSCNLFTDDNFFNEDFINRNGIKSIRTTIANKRTMQPIKSTELWQQYDFDKYGRVVQIMETNNISGTIDTSVVQFRYAGDRLNKKRLTDTKGFFSYAYQYDEEGNMAQKTYSREVNANSAKSNFELGQLIEVYKERYEYTKISDARTKMIIYNSADKPYQQIFYEYDEYGNLSREVKTLVVTKKGSSVEYQYDEYHRPIAKKDISNLTGKNELRYEYEYDDAGNILEERTYQNGVFKTTRQFLYDGRMLLSARLTKDEETGTIQIVKYECFFD